LYEGEGAGLEVLVPVEVAGVEEAKGVGGSECGETAVLRDAENDVAGGVGILGEEGEALAVGVGGGVLGLKGGVRQGSEEEKKGAQRLHVWG